MSAHLPEVTRESIDAAKAAQQAERAQITALTGIDFTADGRLILPRPKAHRPKRWYCPACDAWFMHGSECKACGCSLERAH